MINVTLGALPGGSGAGRAFAESSRRGTPDIRRPRQGQPCQSRPRSRRLLRRNCPARLPRRRWVRRSPGSRPLLPPIGDPIARARVEALEREIEALKQEVETLKQQVRELTLLTGALRREVPSPQPK